MSVFVSSNDREHTKKSKMVPRLSGRDSRKEQKPKVGKSSMVGRARSTSTPHVQGSHPHPACIGAGQDLAPRKRPPHARVARDLQPTMVETFQGNKVLEY